MVVNCSTGTHVHASLFVCRKQECYHLYEILTLSLEGAKSYEVFSIALVLFCCLLTGIIFYLHGCSSSPRSRVYNVQCYVHTEYLHTYLK